VEFLQTGLKNSINNLIVIDSLCNYHSANVYYVLCISRKFYQLFTLSFWEHGSVNYGHHYFDCKIIGCAPENYNRDSG
jgi:hypothetical protein